MVIDVLGFERIDFPDKEDPSRRVNGYNVYFPQPILRNGEGTAYVKKFIPIERVQGSVSLGQADMDIQISIRGKSFVGSFMMLPELKAASSK